MDKKVEIQKLIEAQKLSTSEEYTIFEKWYQDIF